MTDLPTIPQDETNKELVALREKINLYHVVETRERCEGNLLEFVREAWSSIDSAPYVDSWTIEAMCDHLEAVTLGYIPRLLINVPPRCAKTTIASICWQAWTWARSDHSFWSGPYVKFLCGSYNASLSLDNANKARRLMLSPWYQKHWGHLFTLTDDQNTKSKFDNTQGGSRQSTSVGGSLLGLGGDIICIDDPHNTETEKVVETDSDRAKVTSWWKEISSTRLNNPQKSAIVVVMQRLHEGDLSGVILHPEEHGIIGDEEEWVHLMVPMRHDAVRHCVTVKLPQYDSDEPWEDPRVKEGELMWPERFGEKEVARIESRLGIYMASGRLQQRPSPKGGGILKEEWWQPWDEEEAKRYGLEWHGGLKEFPLFDLVVGSLDTSYGEKQENDYNALTIWGIWIDKNKNRRAMLMFAWRRRMQLHGKIVSAYPNEAKVNFEQRQREAWGLVELVADTCKRYKVRRLLIEDRTRGRDVANEINRLYTRENWGVELINPIGDKISRAHSVVPLFTDNAVWAPDTKWSELVIQECKNFPKGDHDDLVDSVSMYLGWARENGLLVRADEMTSAMEDEAAHKPPGQSVAQAYGV